MEVTGLTLEILRAIRGSTSQTHLSRKLGYAGNQVNRWESGDRRILWRDFTRLCALKQLDLRAALENGARLQCDPTRADTLITEIVGNAKLIRLQREMGLSRFSLARWMNGTAEPPLAAVLTLIDRCRTLLFEFLVQLVDPEIVPTLAAESQRRRYLREIMLQFPVASGVLCCLSLDEYRQLPHHERGYVARKLNIDLDEEDAILSRLEAIGQIRLRGGRYEQTEIKLDLRSSDPNGLAKYMRFWMNRILDHYERDGAFGTNSRFGLEILPANDVIKKLCHEEYIAFQYRMRALTLQNHGPTDQVYVVTFATVEGAG